jgi:hypothetical protein
MKDPELLKHIIVAVWKGKRHYKAEDIEIIEAREVPDLCGSFYIAIEYKVKSHGTNIPLRIEENSIAIQPSDIKVAAAINEYKTMVRDKKLKDLGI